MTNTDRAMCDMYHNAMHATVNLLQNVYCTNIQYNCKFIRKNYNLQTEITVHGFPELLFVCIKVFDQLKNFCAV